MMLKINIEGRRIFKILYTFAYLRLREREREGGGGGREWGGRDGGMERGGGRGEGWREREMDGRDIGVKLKKKSANYRQWTILSRVAFNSPISP